MAHLDRLVLATLLLIACVVIFALAVFTASVKMGGVWLPLLLSVVGGVLGFGASKSL